MLKPFVLKIATSPLQTKNACSFTKKKDGFQIIDYSELELEGSELNSKFQRGFGKDGIGSVIVRNIPSLQEKRYQLLPLTQSLANLPDQELLKLFRPENYHQRGWSQKNQTIYGIQDKNLGIFKAHLLKDDKYQKSASQLENLPKRILSQVGDNVWPDDIPELKNKYKKSFLDYHSVVQKTAFLLLGKIEKYIETSQPYFRTSTLSQILKRSNQHLGCQFFSYPNSSYEQLSRDWDYWHCDSTFLSGLSSQIYLNSEGQVQDYLDQDSGLHIFSHEPNTFIKIRLDDKSILFKAGEALQIISGGAIYPKPHRLVRGNFLVGKELSIDYIKTVIQPNIEEKLSVPAGVKVDDVLDKQIQDFIPVLSERWQQGSTYGEFIEKTNLAYSHQRLIK